MIQLGRQPRRQSRINLGDLQLGVQVGATIEVLTAINRIYKKPNQIVADDTLQAEGKDCS